MEWIQLILIAIFSGCACALCLFSICNLFSMHKQVHSSQDHLVKELESMNAQITFLKRELQNFKEKVECYYINRVLG